MLKYFDDTRVAVLIANGFNNFDFYPIIGKLKQSGIQITVISPEEKLVKPLEAFESELFSSIVATGNFLRVDMHPENANPYDYQLLIIPGGAFSAYKLISDNESVSFVNDFYSSRKPIASISHGVRLLSEVSTLKGKFITSPPEYKDMFKSLGATWLDEQIIVDGKLITCKDSSYIDLFIDSIVQAILIEKTIEEFKSNIVKKDIN
jgi:protease I